MASLDDIFKSDLDANKKKSKMLFGRLLLQLKKNNNIRIYSLMSDVIDTDYKDKKLMLIFGVKSTYEMISNPADINTISTCMHEIDGECDVEFVLNEQRTFDCYQFEERLKKEFGKILTIKTKN